ncbi:copper resistance CopC family protein [Planococcus salinarum]|uniref:copper resistance CopC family protein n=1 Tax=Planococcus salinarum TaxID=622695 RepID=UPI00163D9201|nr:copper resistance CopC family protein [Planococcus salinarum]
MKKILFIAILLLIFPVSANAHSGLSSSTPAEGETLDGSPAEIQLQFESAIQQGDMAMTDESGNAVEISDISYSDLELLGQLDEELPNGAYTVDWSALSQDGHEITGTLIFNVAAEASEEEVADEAAEEQASEDTTETEATEEAALSADEEAAATAVEPAKAETPWVTIIIIALLIVAAATFFVMARRK